MPAFVSARRTLTLSKGVRVPSGYTLLRDLDGSILRDLDGQPLWEPA